MPRLYANEFGQILESLRANAELRERVLRLVAERPIVAKSLEGGDRAARFRAIVAEIVSGRLDLFEAYQRVETELPRENSVHANDRKVFPERVNVSDWSERLVMVQLSRFYNQAVLEHLMSEGQTLCFVPHSAGEDTKSSCSVHLAGKEHETAALHVRLVEAYEQDIWGKDPLVPNHPHCTHVIAPVSDGA